MSCVGFYGMNCIGNGVDCVMNIVVKIPSIIISVEADQLMSPIRSHNFTKQSNIRMCNQGEVLITLGKTMHHFIGIITNKPPFST